MNRSRHGQMRSPLKQGNSSSTSLEGMERPVRTFKSFIKTTPPNPAPPESGSKPLPPPPSTGKKISSPTTPASPATPGTGRNPSIASWWKAPADWSTNSHKKESLPSPPVPASRQYSPLLPEPSPDVHDTFMAAQAEASSPRSRLLPIYERRDPDLGPPRSPPRSPLPIPPISSARIEPRETLLSTSHSADASHLVAGGVSDPVSSSSVQGIPRGESPAHSTTSKTSDGSVTEQAYVALGIEIPREQPAVLVNGNHRYTATTPPERHPDRQYLKVRQIDHGNRASPLVENEPRDRHVDDGERHLDFPRDYHDPVPNGHQNIDVVVRPDKVSADASHGPTANHLDNNPQIRHPLRDQHLVPRPLSWQKGSSADSSRSPSQARKEASTVDGGTTSNTKKKRLSNKISTWVPRRLSVGPKRTTVGGTPYTETTPTDEKKQNHPYLYEPRNNPSQTKPPKQKPKQAKKPSSVPEDLRFSKFFPAKKPNKPSPQPKITEETTSKPATSTSPRTHSPAPILQLRGLGISVIRTPPPSDETQSQTTKSGSATNSTNPNSPTSTSNPSEHRHSGSRNLAPHGGRNPFRSSAESGSGVEETTSAAPQVQKLTSSSPSPQHAQHPPEPRRSTSDTTAKPHTDKKPNLIEKAKEAHRKRSTENRHDKLKKSIRVLGPTDPSVVEAYVKREGRRTDSGGVGAGVRDGQRMPGYLVSGPI